MESIVSNINKIRDKEQKKALNNWAVNGFEGSIIAGTGFGKSRCGVIAVGETIKRLEEYNDYVDNVIKRGTNKKGDQVIGEDRTPLLVNSKNDVRVLRNIIRRQEAANSQKALQDLTDFVKALDPQDNLRSGIINYIQKAKSADDLLNFMIGEGLIATKTKKDVIKYVFNHKTFSEESTRRKMSKWLSKFGVHLGDIDKMQSAAEVEIDNNIDARHKGHTGTFTQQKFFSDYFPDATGLGSRMKD